MTNRKPLMLVGAVVFLLSAVVNLSRLLVGVPQTIAGYQLTGTAAFFAFVISAGLSLMLFRESRRG